MSERPDGNANVTFDLQRNAASFDYRFDEDTELSGPMTLRLQVAVSGAEDPRLFVGVEKWSHGVPVPFGGSYGYGRDRVAQGRLRLALREARHRTQHPASARTHLPHPATDSRQRADRRPHPPELLRDPVPRRRQPAPPESPDDTCNPTTRSSATSPPTTTPAPRARRPSTGQPNARPALKSQSSHAATTPDRPPNLHQRPSTPAQGTRTCLPSPSITPPGAKPRSSPPRKSRDSPRERSRSPNRQAGSSRAGPPPRSNAGDRFP